MNRILSFFSRKCRVEHWATTTLAQINGLVKDTEFQAEIVRATTGKPQHICLSIRIAEDVSYYRCFFYPDAPTEKEFTAIMNDMRRWRDERLAINTGLVA
jgi:hypothetical protein